MTRPPPRSTLFPYTTLFRSVFNPRSQARTTLALTYDDAEPPVAAASLRSSLDRDRSEEHTSELQSRRDLVCRLLLEKKNPSREQGTHAAHSRVRAPTSARHE